MDKSERHSPRVVLRKAREGQYADAPMLVLELGLGGAKFEHDLRLDIGSSGTFVCGDLRTHAEVRHSILLPTPEGVIYHTGVSFPTLTSAQKERLFSLLMEEAQEQVGEWEANLEGVAWRPRAAAAPRSVVTRRFISLRRTQAGWQRSIVPDPNQPLDGVTVPDDTPEEELELLRRTYDAGDDAMRQLMRRMAMVGILERMR